ncbi:MAG: TlyA family RNA methyltransferase [Deltaproteobacteria bacterium]|nr:TlyA family RNA methyltransferase [Deltaproteobacteria bacterium]MBW2048947.1 TlyA family RNA methyltransferase [Deltaproteobacteria bacterium]MBW2110860.1 TlyA family RNA methyltransferase [Deltaproteobacteria bacterium]MBW2352349.1 TlyA family RNA methyltransferase [Deltaproteobacteria bacterium]
MTGPKGEKERLDRLLVLRGLAESREKAKALIMAGLVEVEGMRVDKAGHPVPVWASISVKSSGHPYVSRGGVKLEAAIEHFKVDVESLLLLDIGASTGGFTDCLLRHGAGKVIAVDVGYGQLHWKLRQDPRVEVRERTNIRHLTPEDLKTPVRGAVIDVSFISLKLVVPPVSRLLSDRAFIIALIKPQFEVGKGQVGKGGVVRDPALHRTVLDDITRFFEASHWRVEGHIPSPLMGPKGNREFLIYVTRKKDQ